MDRRPTGTVTAGTDDDRTLVLTRTIAASVDEVWASFTESDRLARWYGSYEGEAGPGRIVRVTMTAEEGSPTDDALVLECDPPQRLVVQLGHVEPAWVLTLSVRSLGDLTELVLAQALTAGLDASDVGPGWEYYLDRLAAAEAGQPLPEWDDSYLALGDHYRSVP